MPKTSSGAAERGTMCESTSLKVGLCAMDKKVRSCPPGRGPAMRRYAIIQPSILGLALSGVGWFTRKHPRAICVRVQGGSPATHTCLSAPGRWRASRCRSC